jgi:hypothetical protein
MRRSPSLLAAPAPADLTLGNVIGLNPFHDYDSWRFIIDAQVIAAKSPNGFDYPGQLKKIEARLREQHRLWKGRAST